MTYEIYNIAGSWPTPNSTGTPSATDGGYKVKRMKNRNRPIRFPLRLPKSVKMAVAKIAKEEGVSINQFVATAVAEKLAVMNTVELFADKKKRANFVAFDRIMRRKGGRAPQKGDELS